MANNLLGSGLVEPAKAIAKIVLSARATNCTEVDRTQHEVGEAHTFVEAEQERTAPWIALRTASPLHQAGTSCDHFSLACI
jgi:hypothetical protein